MELRYVGENCGVECDLLYCREGKHLPYDFFWVIPQLLNFMCRHFGTLCPSHLHRWCRQEE